MDVFTSSIWHENNGLRHVISSLRLMITFRKTRNFWMQKRKFFKMLSLEEPKKKTWESKWNSIVKWKLIQLFKSSRLWVWKLHLWFVSFRGLCTDNNNHFSRLNRFAIRPQLNFGFDNNVSGRKFNLIFNFASEIHKSFELLIEFFTSISDGSESDIDMNTRCALKLVFFIRFHFLLFFSSMRVSPSVVAFSSRFFDTVFDIRAPKSSIQNCHSQYNFSSAFQSQILCFKKSIFVYSYDMKIYNKSIAKTVTK